MGSSRSDLRKKKVGDDHKIGGADVIDFVVDSGAVPFLRLFWNNVKLRLAREWIQEAEAMSDVLDEQDETIAKLVEANTKLLAMYQKLKVENEELKEKAG